MNNRPHCTSARSRQQGVALFVALIAMVILSLAGLALVRTIDTTSSVAGNIAFRQGSIGPISQAIEVANNALFKAKTINTLADDTTQSYYAELQPGEKPNGVPAVLAGDFLTMSASYSAAGLPAAMVDPKTLMEVRSVIERVCKLPGDPNILGSCDTLPPKVSKAGTDNKTGSGIPLPAIPNFRVTVRVDLPNSNTVSHAQTFMR
jgi:hypothetical protein